MLSREPAITHVGAELDDFADTAAVLTLCELLVCVDTSVAHVAGALGRPVALLVPFQPDWRWMLDRDTSPWYPSIRLFRQARAARLGRRHRARPRRVSVGAASGSPPARPTSLRADA